MLAESKLKDYERFEEFSPTRATAWRCSMRKVDSPSTQKAKILSYSEDEALERPIAQVVAASDQAVIARVVRL